MSQEKVIKRDSERMGIEPIPGLMIKMGLPLMFSMLVQALYNIIDSVFVSKIGEAALTAVTLCFPFQMLNVAFGIGTAVGMSALLSRYLGAKMLDAADKVAHNGFILVVINYVFFFLVGCLAHPIIAAQTSDPVVIEYATVYLQITQWLSIAPMMQTMFERLLQATGKTNYIMIIQVTGAVINCVMDPILIFGLLGMPEMGVKGAAVATVFGQGVACVIGLIFNKTRNKEVGLHLNKIRPHWQTMKDIYKIGIPSIIMQAIGSVMNFGINQIFLGFSGPIGLTAVATFGVYFKLQSFIFMPIFGLNSATVPLAAYNYGAGKKGRLEHIMSLAAKFGVVVMAIGTVIFWVFPKQLMGIFSPSEDMLAIGITALHVLSLNFPFAGYSIMRGAIFQALGKSVYSMNISIVRQLLVILPVAFIFAKTIGLNAVWWAFPIAEVTGVTMSVLYSRRIKKKYISKMADDGSY